LLHHNAAALAVQWGVPTGQARPSAGTADAVTPNEPILLTVTEYGRRAARTFAMPEVHGATMPRRFGILRCSVLCRQ
jgi:hypothetical protein